MKIQVTKKEWDTLPESYVKVAFIEKGVERIVKDGSSETFQVVSGKLDRINPRTLRTLMRGIVQSAKKQKIEKLAIALTPEMFPKTSMYGLDWFWSTIVENLIMANYEHNQYKSKPPEETLTEILIDTKDDKAAKKGVERGLTVGEATSICRDIANTTGGEMTPAILAEMAKRYCKHPKTKVSVLDDKKIAQLGMGGVMGVGKGSIHKPRFIIIEYKGGATKEEPIVLVGKGVTFDTGGLQVKPGMSMYEMHMDMSGGASVIGAIAAIAKLGIKKNVIGLIPAVENAISGEAMRPGDVLKMMNGTTVEVLHTDAEGRLILADALCYAQRYNPSLIVDVATLTGAASVAVGQHANVIVTKSRRLEDRLRELGEESGDYTFPLPLWDEYITYTKGGHADLTNIQAGDTRYGGSINGAAFLSNFVKKKLKWVHIDMAPRMTANALDKLVKGAAGEPTRLLIKIVETF